MKALQALFMACCATLLATQAQAGDRLLATGGVMDVEGSAGGGLTPWALIAGLGTNQQVGATGFCTRVVPQDFSLTSCGVAVGLMNRVELSVAHQDFSLGDTVPGHHIEVNVVGAKLRLYGDAVTDQGSWIPQLALGAQFKHNLDFDFIPQALGAKSADGTDLYLAATRIWLAGPFGHTWLANLTLRSTRANQLGILGFGGDQGGTRLEFEGSAASFLTDHLVLGAEYRQKPDNLSVFREDDYKDVFLAWIPFKYVALTVAYADLGNIANHDSQHGLYASLQANW
ncbi:MAG TPA: DUF3034 family protein [Steroidobacteraceae bacterium]|nr:DUF3034 family protein [Steroidobacteraceae bacterium]